MKDKLKKFLTGVAKSTATDIVRGYLVSRIKSISPDSIIEAIEKDDTDLVSKLGEKDRKLLVTLSVRFREYLDLLTPSNVFEWLVEDLPFYAGVIYGHPKGLEWLTKVVTQVKLVADKVNSELGPSPNLELTPIEH